MRPWRNKLYVIIFEHETWGGRAFDVALLWCIVGSVMAVMLESVTSIRNAHGPLLRSVEWAFTLLFTVEYVLRLVSIGRPLRYVFSLFGLVDVLSVIPTYASLLLPGAQSLLVLRALRLLRVFRILKLGEYVGEAHVLAQALRASRQKITVFVSAVLTIVLIVGAMMYLIEGEEHGFTSIPVSVYWAVVTMTTVGYGDIAPQTVAGQVLASALMIIGYGVIAVPTGIVSVELAQAVHGGVGAQTCPACACQDHDGDANYCKRCGQDLRGGDLSENKSAAAFQPGIAGTPPP
ncbi:MAG: ion transporter [Bryobacteraceae bacterium]